MEGGQEGVACGVEGVGVGGEGVADGGDEDGAEHFFFLGGGGCFLLGCWGFGREGGKGWVLR